MNEFIGTTIRFFVIGIVIFVVVPAVFLMIGTLILGVLSLWWLWLIIFLVYIGLQKNN